MNKYVYREEFLTENKVREIYALVMSGNQEIYNEKDSFLKDRVIVNEDGTSSINFQMYIDLQKSGNLVFNAMRNSNGVLVGCSICFMFPHIHSSFTLVANNSFFYIMKKDRTPKSFNNLLDSTEKSLSIKGVDFYEFSSSVKSKKLNSFLVKRKGFKVNEVNLIKKLKEE